MQESAKAAEGVMLSGVRMDRDCVRTELWRHPPRAGAEGASAMRKLSGKRTKIIFHLMCFLFLGVRLGTPYFYYKENKK